MSIVVIINNYLHDVASAMLLASAFIVWLAGRRIAQGASPAAFIAAYPVLKRIAWGSVAWIVVGGIPRAIFFTRYEWDPAVVRGIVPALVVKHALMTAAIVVGVVMWTRVLHLVRSRREGEAAA